MGHTAYLLEGIQELSQLKPIHIRIELSDRVIEDDYLFGAISNSTSVGGVLTIDPKRVELADGMFELLLVRAPKDLAELSECVVALQKQTYNCGMITFLSTNKLTVYTNGQLSWTLDGERAEGTEVTAIENLHNAICLMVKG